MLARLGEVLYWAAFGIAILIGVLAAAVAIGLIQPAGLDISERLMTSAAFFVIGALVWAIGRGALYVLAGR